MRLTSTAATSIGARAPALPLRQAFPYLQTHQMDFRPLWADVKRGYAPFLAGGELNGDDRVTLRAPVGTQLPAGGAAIELTGFNRRGEWHLPDAERVKTALGGTPPAGEYAFEVRRGGALLRVITLPVQPRFLATPTKLTCEPMVGGKHRIRWQAPPGADSFHVFLVPEGSKNVLGDLVQVSHPNLPRSELQLADGCIRKGRYHVAVRANQHLRNGFPGYARESWGMSEKAFELGA